MPTGRERETLEIMLVSNVIMRAWQRYWEKRAEQQAIYDREFAEIVRNHQ